MSISSRNLAAACALDWVAGDPHWFPHPVRAIGFAISTGELLLRPGTARPAEDLVRGGLLTAAVVSASWAVARCLAARGVAGEILLAWTVLAAGSLRTEATQVVEADTVVKARRKLSMIVGRDTEDLDEEEIARAVIETVAESLCDGVVAPLFYLMLGGVPWAFAYKAISTLDSMIGHHESPYRYFGRVAARLDDAANWLPARLAAAAIVTAAALTGQNASGAWRVWLRDGGKHPSPNAGRTEAAMAGALSVCLGGLNHYGGAPSPKPLLGAEGRAPRLSDARAAIRVVAVASALVCVAATLFRHWTERE